MPEASKRRLGLRRGRALEKRADARQQLGDLEGLAQVVVGAGIEPRDNVVGLRARGEHQDRDLEALLADVTRNVEAVDARKHQVEQHEIHIVRLEQLDRGRTLAGPQDVETCVLELELDEPRDRSIILDDQDGLLAHDCTPLGGATPPPAHIGRVCTRR